MEKMALYLIIVVLQRSTHLPTEVANVFFVLSDFNLFYHLSEGRTVACTILPHHPYLLCSFRLVKKKKTKYIICTSDATYYVQETAKVRKILKDFPTMLDPGSPRGTFKEKAW